MGLLSALMGVAATTNWLMFSNPRRVAGLTAKRRAALLAQLESRQGTLVWVAVTAMSAFVAVAYLIGGRSNWWIWLIAAACQAVSVWVRYWAAERVRGYLAKVDGPVTSPR
jgi:1,4-dihydroxy-2-naphthoate octaprenyltransferase